MESKQSDRAPPLSPILFQKVVLPWKYSWLDEADTPVPLLWLKLQLWNLTSQLNAEMTLPTGENFDAEI